MTATFNANITRENTARRLRECRARFGDDHPATYAAFARAVVAWCGRLGNTAPVVGPEGPSAECKIAYGRALHRADGHLVENRHRRVT